MSFDPFSQQGIAIQAVVLSLGGAAAVGIGLEILSSTLKSHPSFLLAIELLSADEAICEKLGSPVVQKDGFLDLASGKIDLVGGTMSCNFAVAGPRGEATVEYTARAVNSMNGTVRAEDLQWVVSSMAVQSGGQEFVITDPSAAAGAAFAGKLNSEGVAVAAEPEGIPLWSKIAVTGTAGLLIGGVASVVINRLVRSKKPQAYWSVYDKIKNSPGVLRTCGTLEREGEHELIGRYDATKADFHFMFKGSNGSGRASVTAKLDEKDVWRFSDITVNVPEMKRPIKVHKGE
jgi:hypothetical protein